MSGVKRRLVPIRMTEELRARAAARAGRLGVSVNDLVVRALEMMLEATEIGQIDGGDGRGPWGRGERPR
jgi:hypothetical protein